MIKNSLEKTADRGKSLYKFSLMTAGSIIGSVAPFAIPYVQAETSGLGKSLNNIQITPIDDPAQNNSRNIIVNIATKIISIMLLLGGILAVAYLIYSGIIYITAGGDTAKADKGRTGVINAVIGLIIIGAAFLLVRFAGSLLRGTTGLNGAVENTSF